VMSLAAIAQVHVLAATDIHCHTTVEVPWFISIENAPLYVLVDGTWRSCIL
jgi:hypothetical protein